MIYELSSIGASFWVGAPSCFMPSASFWSKWSVSYKPTYLILLALNSAGGSTVVIHAFKRHISRVFSFSFSIGFHDPREISILTHQSSFHPARPPPKQSRNIHDAHKTKSPMKKAQLRGQPFLTLSSCKGFFGNPHNSNHTNSKPKQQNTSTTRMLLTSMELVGGSSLSRKKSHLHMEMYTTKSKRPADSRKIVIGR